MDETILAEHDGKWCGLRKRSDGKFTALSATEWCELTTRLLAHLVDVLGGDDLDRAWLAQRLAATAAQL